MRVARILTPILLALTLAACMHQQQEQSYYLIDPTTGQPVPVAQQAYGQPQYAQAPPYQQSAQGAYQQPHYAQSAHRRQAAQNTNRNLYSSPQAAQQAYAPQAYAQPAYQPPPQSAQNSGGRGLFTQRSQTQQAQQAYAVPAYGQQNVVMQYRPAPAAGGPYAAAPNGYATAAPYGYPSR